MPENKSLKHLRLNNSNARLRFFLSAPVLAKITADMKNINGKPSCTNIKHHQDSHAEILRHSEMERKLFNVLSEGIDFFGNHEEDSIFNIMTNAVIPLKHHEKLLSCETIGQAYIVKFVHERMSKDSEVSIWAPIKLLRLPTFRVVNKKIKIAINDKYVELQEHVELFSRCALVASSNREFDMKEVIGRHELSVMPRSLMLSDGSLIPGHEGKSSLMNAIAHDGNELNTTSDLLRKTIIIDAIYVVQSLDNKTNQIKTCADIARHFIAKCAYHADRYGSIRISFDKYLDVSLKNATRERRKRQVASIQFKIDDTTEIIGSLKQFLSNEETKSNLAKSC